MATQVTAGTLLRRRGTDGLTPVMLDDLLKNPQKVQKILDDIDARRAVYLETEKRTQVTIDKLVAVEAGLTKREAALEKALAKLEEERTAAAEKHASNMEALSRRTREVGKREQTADDRDVALDARSNEIESQGRIRETELAERERVVEAQEAASEKRDVELGKKARGIDDDATRLNTALRVVTEAVSRLNAARR